MFRPTHFVILFAVVLYANADPSSLAPENSGKLPDAGESKILPSTLPAAALEAKPAAAKADLQTDATVYWRYNYYGPRLGCNPGRTIGWGFGIARDYDLLLPNYLYRSFYYAK